MREHEQRRWRATATAGWILCNAAVSGCMEPAAETPSGARLYATHCAACHGPDGEGDGPVAAVMQTNVPNLRSLTARGGGVFPADSVTAYVDGRELPVSHGDRQMPIWGDVFGTQDGGDDANLVRARIESIVGFIQEIQYR